MKHIICVQENEDENEDVNENKDLKDLDLNKPKKLKNLNEKYTYLDKPEFKERWDAFIEMRKSIKSKPTEKAIELIMTKLHATSIDHACKMLENSIENNWKGVFPLKNDKFKLNTIDDIKRRAFEMAETRNRRLENEG